MEISEITHRLEMLAHPSLQESYDNAGLIVGDRSTVCTGVLVSLDVTEQTVEEAIDRHCNLIVAHHPIIFRGLKKLTGSGYVERIIIKAIKNDIAIFAIHTNLDNVLHGVNGRLASLLHLKNCRVLDERKNTLKKIVTFVPGQYAEAVRKALFDAGAGAIGDYDECSFNVEGTGTFKALEGAHPFVGEVGQRHEERETRVEMIFPFYLENKVIDHLKKSHPYEEVAYYISELGNTEKQTGSGIIGDLNPAMEEMDLMKMVKEILNIPVLKHTRLLGRPVGKVALCGGSGFFLLPAALAQKADIYITADIKYHEFFDADGKILLVDAGHFETEQYTVDLLSEYLKNNFPNFAVLKTEHSTNPVYYLK